MKKYLLVLTVLILVSGKLHAQQLSLDDTIRRTARALEDILPQDTMVAVLNFDSPSQAFSDFVIEELTGVLVTGRRVTVVDRRNLELIGQEMDLQLSGYVSDESAQSIGHMLGAQSIVSGVLTSMGTFYRFMVRVINVQTAAIQTQISLDLRNDAQVAFLMRGSSARIQPDVPVVAMPDINQTEVIIPPIDGIIVPGANLTEKLAWLQRSADSHNTYILEVRADESIAPQRLEYRGAINITIVLRGVGANRTIRLRSHGAMFRVRPNVTFILENNITLQGHNGNNSTMVHLDGGTFIMRTGSVITGNVITSTNWTGGGVGINSGTFEMTGGTISGNTVARDGGGVGLLGGTFTMTGGTISDNTASRRGGGVNVGGGTFNMRGGSITGNVARNDGGGVTRTSGTFTKTGGIITGYSSDRINGNVVRDEVGNILARRGHAVFVNENLRHETTAGPGRNLSNRDSGRWD